MAVRIFGDSTTARDIPQWVDGVGGYVNGNFAWSPADWALFADKPQIRYNVTGDPERGNAADIEAGDMTPENAVIWYTTRAHMNAPNLAVYVNRDNIDAVMAEIERFNPFIILTTLDGTCPQFYHGHKLAAVQFAGPDQTGGHYDLTIVYDDDFHPAPHNGPDSVIIATARTVANKLAADHARLAALVNAI